jgi:hypothetical protein
MPDPEFVRKFYIFRLLVDEPITPSSVARCEARNRAEGGAIHSAHLTGAADVPVTKENEYRYIRAAQRAGMTGIGISDNTFMHMDDKHDPKAVWTY